MTTPPETEWTFSYKSTVVLDASDVNTNVRFLCRMARMPKVTAAYREARRDQIIRAARTCFLRDGFHATSMQDLFAESGVSSGAFYSYFGSKDDVILAIAERNIGEIVDLLAGMSAPGRDVAAGDALAEALELISDKHGAEAIGALAVQVWAEAARNDRLRARFAELVDTITAQLADLAARRQAQGELPADVPPRVLARTFISTVTGYILQLALLGPGAVDEVPDALRALWPARSPSRPGGSAASAASAQ
jgi:AcrR family transcriptional regulator